VGKYRLAVDVGGTFIDYILMDEETGLVTMEKQPARADTLVDEFMNGLNRLDVDPGNLNMFVHGTTVVLNALVQERGAKTGLITTKGFRDVLELGRAGRPFIYDLRYQPEPPLVPRYLRREVTQRMAADGKVLAELDLATVKEQVDFLVAHSVQAIAICLLHAYANPAHETAIADYIKANHPDVSVCTSSELVREWREYERTSTTVINAYTQPLISKYAHTIDQRVREAGFSQQIAFVRSNGSVMPIGVAADRPVETLNSGPAGGVIGAHALMKQAGYPNVVCADVGGTTYDVAIIHDGEIVERTNTEIHGRPVLGSVIDIESIGAGGGSIALLDPRSGSMRVGPESAGAFPGPACFGLGGTRPTVTDAQVILGLLDPDRFLGQRMKLDRSLSEKAIKDEFGADADVEKIAEGIITIAQTNMANAIRVMTTQRGLDPRDFAMLSFGGGGGLFAAGVADELGIREVIVPQAAAGFSAWGMLNADFRKDATETSVILVTPEAVSGIRDRFATLAETAKAELDSYGFTALQYELLYSADVRYLGQDHTITTPIPAEVLDQGPEAFIDHLANEFTRRHLLLYGHGDAKDAVQIVTLRCRGLAPIKRPKMVGVFADTLGAPVATRPVHFADGQLAPAVPVYERTLLTADASITGPAFVDEWTTTVVIPPGWSVKLDEAGSLIITKGAGNG
jgi:N-methylhydantoinase A